MAGLDPEPDIANLFCYYNALYFRDSLGACAVSWAEEPLPYGTFSVCDYYPGGGGCIVLLSKSLYECHPESDLKNVLLHEMIHAYMCVKDNNTNHSDHGVNFQKLMNAINSSSVPDAHRPIGGYGIIMKHDIGNKYHQYRCESCGDLVKSTKIRGPSPDDCIERMAANNLCLNSMCQWHRHEKHCSGSYHPVRESPTGRVRLKRSIASSAEETLDECKADESAGGSWHAKHTSSKCGTRNKHEREDASAKFFHPTDDAIDNSKRLGSSSGGRSSKKIKLSNDIGFDHLTATTAQQPPKRPRTEAIKKNQGCSRQKKRKISKWDGSYSVLIERMNYYFVDNSDEDEVPLINKRTERRKRQKHEKHCSGSYHPVRESPTGRVRLKRSIASSAEETLDECKADESAGGSWHAKHTSSKCGTRNKHEREDASAKFFHPTDDAIDNSKRLGSSSGGRSSKKIKLSNDIGFDHLTATTAQQPPKRPRTEAIKKNQGCSRQKKRKISKWDGSYSVLIERMNYYFVDNSDEDEVPLINKRTERRKRQKLLQSSQATEPNNGFGGTTSSSCSQGAGDDNRSEIVPASQVDERLLPHHPVSNHVAAADQSGRGTVSATSDSPMVGDIVVISDG